MEEIRLVGLTWRGETLDGASLFKNIICILKCKEIYPKSDTLEVGKWEYDDRDVLSRARANGSGDFGHPGLGSIHYD